MVAIALLQNPLAFPAHRTPPLSRPQLRSVPPGAAAVMALTEGGCRWPLGEVADDDFTFCGAPRGRGSYCGDHRPMAYAGVGR